MKRLVMFLVFLFLCVCIAGCSDNSRQDFYGTYTFKEVSYLSLLSSSTIDSINERMAGTEYVIEADLFKINSAENPVENPVEIKSPIYVKENIPEKYTVLSDIRKFIGRGVKNQYTILNSDGSKTHLRLYTSSNCLWIGSYNDNTVNGSDVIMNIFKLSK